MNNILRIAIIICTSYVAMPSYAMDRESKRGMYKQMVDKTSSILGEIDEEIANGSLTSEQAIRRSIEKNFGSCAADDELRKRVAGRCVSQYRDILNQMPLALVLNGNRRFYVDWKDDTPQSAYMVTEENPGKVLIWQHYDNGWKESDTYTLDVHEKNIGINFVQPLGKRLALGIYKNNNRTNAVLRIYEKQDRPNTNDSIWKKCDKIRVMGGDVMSCAVTNDLKYCAMLISTFYSGKQLRLKLFKQGSSGPYQFLWEKNVDDAREIVSLVPPTLTMRADGKSIEVNINNGRFSSKLTPHPYENPRSVTRLIAHTLYQNHLVEKVMPIMPVPAAIPSRPGSDDGNACLSPITQEWRDNQDGQSVVGFDEAVLHDFDQLLDDGDDQDAQ